MNYRSVLFAPTSTTWVAQLSLPRVLERKCISLDCLAQKDKNTCTRAHTHNRREASSTSICTGWGGELLL